MKQETYDKAINLLEEMQADIKVANNKLDKMDSKFNRIDSKLNRIDDKLDRIDNKLDNLSKEFNEGVNRIISIGGK
ncbi:hypothetical protein [Megamonas funiformis]|uniref:hypothetical protein n=1 Tax=Megamonas funiformis TaxID=437897 RepID=UPI0019570F12|nr:hypothetical protein [Megamonas funiformis]MBM6651794.1 hypothetical protein [Megamonas funiformis]